jgi:archaemetzincin
MDHFASATGGFAYHGRNELALGMRKALDDVRIGYTLGFYAPSSDLLTFVFGEAQLDGNCAVVSTARLKEEFYGLPRREELFLERLIKEAAHELGHTFGLRHCMDWRCVMASSHAVERLDVKGAEFCKACRKTVLEDGYW